MSQMIMSPLGSVLRCKHHQTFQYIISFSVVLTLCLVLHIGYITYSGEVKQEKFTEPAENNLTHNREIQTSSFSTSSCPVDYYIEQSRDRSVTELLSGDQASFSYQTHLTEEVWNSNYSLFTYANLSIPKVFNTSFVNPCWYEPLAGDNRELKCMPYFFLIGFAKCGTSDLFQKLTVHPEIYAKLKEHQWWTRKRYPSKEAPDGSDVMPLEDYIDRFRKAATCMESIANLHLSGPVRLITGDGSPTTVWENNLWSNLPGNADAEEPRVLVADHIRHYLPASKIIVIMRNPIDRLFSDYLYFWKLSGKPSPKDFHDKVVETMDKHAQCQIKHSLRACLYGLVYGKVRLRVGIYSVYLNDWFRIFPKSQIHVLRTEDYHVSMETELKKIFNFLELDPLEESVYHVMRDLPRENVHSPKQAKMSMLSKTEAILRDFYAPFNEELAQMLNNTDYLWKDE